MRWRVDVMPPCVRASARLRARRPRQQSFVPGMRVVQVMCYETSAHFELSLPLCLFCRSRHRMYAHVAARDDSARRYFEVPASRAQAKTAQSEEGKYAKT